MIFAKLIRDTRGAVVIEAAFAIPVLVTIMIGILQFALVLQASGAMRYGIGEGLRYAKVNPDATSKEVLDVARGAMAGVDLDGLVTTSYAKGSVNGAEYGRIILRYELKPVIPFAAIPPITLSETRRAYLPS